ERYFSDPRDPDSLSHDTVFSLLENPAGTLWIGTGGGLTRMDTRTNTFTRFTENDGLPSNSIQCVLAHEGDLWISTKRGLSRFTPDPPRFRNYDVKDGLQGNDFSRACAGLSDGDVVFGGFDGINIFSPGRIEDNTRVPPIVLTNFTIANKPAVLNHPPWEVTNIDLSYKDSVFAFEFAALDYADPHKNRYACMLEGFDPDWTHVDSDRRFAAYTNLDPGKYVFRVKGSNNDGVWNEEGLSVEIMISAPWWETIWFRIAMLALIAGSVGGGVRWRLSAVERQKRRLEARVAERTRELRQEVIERESTEEELRNAKEAAVEAQRVAEVANHAKSVFLANMSHELRTPLNAILGFARVMDHNRAIPPGDKEHLAIIRNSGEHLLNLINDVLDMSKIEAGRTVLNERDVDLHRLLDDVEGMFCLKAEETGLLLVFERHAGVPRYIRTDDGKLRQTLVNLLNNALKFTKEGGVTVKIEYCPLIIEKSVEKDKNPQSSIPGLFNPQSRGYSILNPQSPIPNLLFSIIDTGPGIAPGEQGSLFKAFIQAETGRKSREGTGLGLPISRKFIQMMGGDITVESEVGKGAVFRFGIRAESAKGAGFETARPDRRVIALATDQPRYRILIVDDMESNRSLLLELLAPPGFELREAENGEEAVEIQREWEPHLIFMDMRMPVMDGLEAAKIIRKAEVEKSRLTGEDPGKSQISNQKLKIKIVAVTANAFEEDRAAALSAGCNDFVRKPFRETDIFDVLSRHLGARFDHETPSPAGAPETSERERNARIVAALAAAPADVAADLEQAIMNIDLERTSALIERIGTRDALLA
ncbi:MAG: response regulator, partial [Desulfobacterales bacterium]|nr:response regulator [Desulfobacterales bacterium]